MLLRGQEHPHVAEMGYSFSVADVLGDGETEPISWSYFFKAIQQLRGGIGVI